MAVVTTIIIIVGRHQALILFEQKAWKGLLVKTDMKASTECHRGMTLLAVGHALLGPRVKNYSQLLNSAASHAS